MIQPDVDASHQLHGGKRSRKSACPKRILQNQQQTEAKASGIRMEPDASCLREDGEKRQRREPSPFALPPHPPHSNFPIQHPSLPPPLLPAKEDSGGAALLRSLASNSSQSLIPTLYAALGGGGGGGGGGFFSFAGAELGMMDGSTDTDINGNADSLEASRFRGRPKSTAVVPNGPFRQQHQLQQKHQNHQQHQQQEHQPKLQQQQQHPQQQRHQQQQKPQQQRRGPRPFDPHLTPEPVRIITRKGVAYNRRPRSFYSSDIKLAVIEFAEQHGASAAERHFNVPLSTVQSWMRHDNKVRIMQTSSQKMPPLTPAQFPQPQLPPLPPLPPTQLPLNLTFPLPSSRR